MKKKLALSIVMTLSLAGNALAGKPVNKVSCTATLKLKLIRLFPPKFSETVRIKTRDEYEKNALKGMSIVVEHGDDKINLVLRPSGGLGPMQDQYVMSVQDMLGGASADFLREIDLATNRNYLLDKLEQTGKETVVYDSKNLDISCTWELK